MANPKQPMPDAIFREACDDVAPLRQPDTVEPYRRRPAPEPLQSRRNDDATLREMAEALMPEGEIETSDDLLYHRPGLQHQVLRKLRRGQYTIQGQLDLHGLRADEAKVAVGLFLQDATARGLSCVRIVHGKGNGSRDLRPVLKPRVAGWLVKRNDVLAYCSARANDGGTGAIYVLLRRG